MTPSQLTGKASDHLEEVWVGEKAFLVHPKVTHALMTLREAALEAGFDLCVASGFRDYDRQKAIWNRKMSGEAAVLDSHSRPLDAQSLTIAERIHAIMRWSAVPGASRHHWGTDFDVYARNLLPRHTSLKLEPWEYHTGHQQPFYLWLSHTLQDYGFFFPYNTDRGGVAPEPWHISHRATAETCLSHLTPTLLTEQWHDPELLGKEYLISNVDTLYTQFITNISA